MAEGNFPHALRPVTGGVCVKESISKETRPTRYDVSGGEADGERQGTEVLKGGSVFVPCGPCLHISALLSTCINSADGPCN